MSSTVDQLPHHQLHFATYVVGAMLVVLLVISFGKSDQRGLLFRNIPEAFAANELEQQGQSFAIEFSGAPAGVRLVRRTIGQNVPSLSNPSASPISSIEGDVPGTPGNQSQLAASDGILPPGTSTELQQLTLANLPAAGGGSSANGLLAPTADAGAPVIPDDPTQVAPTIPAVPEPASWLLMILGVAVLGQVLRRRAAQGLLAKA